MAELNTGGGDKHKGGKKRSKKASTRVDLTPMVDLGFLLITFFMLATTLIKPQTMEISMPSTDKVKKEDEQKVKASKAITVILAKNNKVFYYFGLIHDNKTNLDAEVKPSSFSPKTGIRLMLLDRNANVVARIKELKKLKERSKMSDEKYKKLASEIRADTEAPSVMITATDDAKYNNLVNILDEMSICNVSKYAIVNIEPEQLKLIKPLDK